jgi:hypothetical protein
MKELTHTLSSGLPLWELESQSTFEFSEGNYKGQINSIEKLFIPLKTFYNMDV